MNCEVKIKQVSSKMAIKGIGVDIVDLDEIKRLLNYEHADAFLAKTFAQAERDGAPSKDFKSNKTIEYFASRFAAKEAVFKALAHLLPEHTFDLRIVETQNRPDGSPFVNTNGKLGEFLNAAGASNIFISLSSESNAAIAFVVIE